MFSPFRGHLFTLHVLVCFLAFGNFGSAFPASNASYFEDYVAKDSLSLYESRDLSKRAPPEIKVSEWSGGNHPTYKYIFRDVGFYTINRDLVDEWVRQAYMSMRAHLEKSKKEVNAEVMAALWIPKRGVFFCSVPYGDAKEEMQKGAARAPAWAERVRIRLSEGILHAEDAAAFQYEKDLNPKLQPDSKYPEGSYMAVYGRTSDGVITKMCSGGKNPKTGLPSADPSCKTVFTSLNVNTRDSTVGQPGPSGKQGPAGPVGPTGPQDQAGPSYAKDKNRGKSPQHHAGPAHAGGKNLGKQKIIKHSRDAGGRPRALKL